MTIQIRIQLRHKRPGPGEFILRLAAIVSAQIGVIGIGVVVGSAAMQWAGFLLLAGLLLAIAHKSPERRLMTISEARRELDRIEKEEAA